jgi:hypothetical protein
MIVCAIRVADGEARIELVESGDSFNGVRVQNTATVDVRIKVWLAGALLFNRVIAAGATYTRSITARTLSSYIDTALQAAYSATVA